MSIAQAQNLNNLLVPVFLTIVLIVFAVWFFLAAKYFRLWLQCFLARANISLPRLLTISLRKADPRVIVSCKIMAVQSGLEQTHNITTDNLEAHYLAGGDVPKVVKALIVAGRRGTELTFEQAASMDLAGRDVVSAAQANMMLGNVCVSETVIHPAGSVVIDGKSTDAVSLEGSIDAGQRVEVIAVRDNIVEVRQHTSR